MGPSSGVPAVSTVTLSTTLVSAVLFLGYGSLVLFTGGMRAEFERFGLERFRRATGALEVIGGVGLLVGLLRTEVLIVASGGLAVLMLLGVLTRIRVRDPILEIAPAAVLMLANGAILVAAWGHLQGP
jgi:hypothetical protein